MSKSMTILFVAMSNSIHTARWLSQISDQGWDIHLFSSINAARIHPDIRNLTFYNTFYSDRGNRHDSVVVKGFRLYSDFLVNFIQNAVARVFPGYRSRKLANLIKHLKPDLIHSLEIQNAGYLTLEAKKIYDGDFPSWIVTNWGSDIYLFGRLSKHVQKIKDVMSACDYYDCECDRDIELARNFGFKGKVLPVLPNSGGFDIKRMHQHRQSGPTSERRLILLKGYQGWAGRALVGLRAIELSADVLQGYHVAVYLAGRDVRLAAELVSYSTGIPIKIIPNSPHEEILHLHGSARLSIGLSISDAISTSMLEAMIMGSFPIQSNTSCTDEWLRDGQTGMIVHPEDPEAVGEAIRHAVTDDTLLILIFR